MKNRNQLMFRLVAFCIFVIFFSSCYSAPSSKNTDITLVIIGYIFLDIILLFIIWVVYASSIEIRTTATRKSFKIFPLIISIILTAAVLGPEAYYVHLYFRNTNEYSVNLIQKAEKAFENIVVSNLNISIDGFTNKKLYDSKTKLLHNAKVLIGRYNDESKKSNFDLYLTEKLEARYTSEDFDSINYFLVIKENEEEDESFRFTDGSTLIRIIAHIHFVNAQTLVDEFVIKVNGGAPPRATLLIPRKNKIAYDSRYGLPPTDKDLLNEIMYVVHNE